MNERERTARALQRVEETTGFYIHGLVFLLVNALLLGLNLSLSPEELWMPWVFVGWGLGVLLHAALVFGKTPAFITRWQLRRIRDARASM
jgi:hypothetical protein